MPTSVAAALRVELTHLAGRIQRRREALAMRYVSGGDDLDEQHRRRRDEQYVHDDEALQRQLRGEIEDVVRRYHDHRGLSLREAAAALGSSYPTVRRRYLAAGAPLRSRGRPTEGS
jgi:hypothetical protein